MSRATSTRFASCAVEGCEGNAHWTAKGGKGFCNNHLYRLNKHGSPLGGRIPPGEAERFLREVVLVYAGDECLTWPYAKNSAGYGHLQLDGKHQLVHRLACEAEHGPAPAEAPLAAHGCGKGHLACCARKHLRWATEEENKADMIGHGSQKFGEQSRNSKLTEQAVRAIRASTATNSELAAQFGVDRANIVAIRNMKTWRHVS